MGPHDTQRHLLNVTATEGQILRLHGWVDESLGLLKFPASLSLPKGNVTQKSPGKDPAPLDDRINL